MTDQKFTTMYHPTLLDVSEDVPTGQVGDWTDQGWRKTPLKPAEK